MKRSRKQSYDLERMLLCRTNGFYHSTERFEEEAISDGENLLDPIDHPTTNHKKDESCNSMEGTNHVRDELRGEMGRPNHLTYNSYDHKGLTNEFSFLTRTNRRTDESRNDTRANHTTADDSCHIEKTYKRSRQVSSDVREQRKIYMTDSSNREECVDTTITNTTAQTYENISTSSPRTNETDVDLKEVSYQGGSHKDPNRVFRRQKDTKHNPVFQVNLPQRRSSI